MEYYTHVASVSYCVHFHHALPNIVDDTKLHTQMLLFLDEIWFQGDHLYSSKTSLKVITWDQIMNRDCFFDYDDGEYSYIWISTRKGICILDNSWIHIFKCRAFELQRRKYVKKEKTKKYVKRPQVLFRKYHIWILDIRFGMLQRNIPVKEILFLLKNILIKHHFKNSHGKAANYYISGN